MKRILAGVLSAWLLLLAACGNTSDEFWTETDRVETQTAAPESQSRSQTEPENETESEPVSQTRSEVDSVTEIESDTRNDTDTESDTESEAVVGSESESDRMSEEGEVSLTEPLQRLTVTYLRTPVHRNQMTTIVLDCKPSTMYRIEVHYQSGISSAKGLEDKLSDDEGRVYWSWKIGGKTAPGTYKIVVTGGGESLTTYFSVTD